MFFQVRPVQSTAQSCGPKGSLCHINEAQVVSLPKALGGFVWGVSESLLSNAVSGWCLDAILGRVQRS
jgi:hypothetical protein